MTREETREAAAVMLAWAEGKEIQASNKSQPQWVNISKEPHWDWHYWDYRIEPIKKLRPWTPDEVPVGAITRYKDSVNKLNRSRQIIEGENGMVAFLCGAPCTFDYLLETREYSTDFGKTWLPCGVEETNN